MGSIISKGYIGTGYIDSFTAYTKDFWEYNPETNVWTQKADFGGAGRYYAVGFSIGNKGYVGTGYGLNGWTKKDLWEYDPTANAWVQTTNWDGIARYGAVGFSIESKGYIGMGFIDAYIGEPSVTDSVLHAPLASVSRDYISAASDSTQSKNDFWTYDPATNTWSRKADFGVTSNYPPVCAYPVKVSGNNYYTIQDAYNNATTGSTVQITEGLFNTGNLEFNRNISTMVTGGYNCGYNIKTGFSTVDGTVTIKGGSVTVEGLIIK